MAEFFEHQLDLTKNNLNKIKNGAQTALKHSQIGLGLVIHVSGENHKRIMLAHRKGKGTRVKLSKDELDQNVQAGTGLGQFMHSIGINNGVRKLKNTGKLIARTALPALGQMAGDALAIATGNPELAPLAQAFGNQIGQQVSHVKGLQNGKGLFRTLHKMGIHKKHVLGVGKHLAKQGLDMALQTASAKVGDNALGQQLLSSAHQAAHAGLDKGLNAGLAHAKASAVDMAHNQLPQARELIHNTIMSHTGNADLANMVADHAHNTAASAITHYGDGIIPFAIKHGGKLHRVLGGEVDSSYKKGYSSTLAPNNPAMTPFVEYDSPYQPTDKVPKSNMEIKRNIKGGSFK